MTTDKELAERRDGIKQWLDDNSPFVFADQKHLDEGSPERAYWHHGYYTALTDVLRSERAVAVPAGWKLVPVEPTQEMLDACVPDFEIVDAMLTIAAIHGASLKWKDDKPPTYHGYKSMLAAAPQAPDVGEK